LILINVDWFFVSHFLHLARRARAAGFEVAIATEVGNERERLEAEGVRIVPLPVRRGGVLPQGVAGTVGVVADELRRTPGTVLHGIGLFGIGVGTMAADRAGSRSRVFTITGRGYTAVSDSMKARAVRNASRLFCRRVADRRSVRWIAENANDLRACGLERAVAERRAVVVGGVGVDPAVFAAHPMPERPPLKAALVGRMIWTKGVDLAVEGVSIARSRGANVELTIAGGLDPAHPGALSADDMAALAARPGVSWLGKVTDQPAEWPRYAVPLWAAHHVAILPSRGGEGVPRALIEAASCGRPILTTRIPGRQELAERTSGWTVPVDDAEVIAAALMDATADPELQARGDKARTAVEAHYTEAANWAATESLYDDLRESSAVPSALAGGS